MRKFILLLLTLLPICLAAQSNATAAEQADQENENDNVYIVVETMPMYPGGQQALFKFLSENTHYPEEAFKNGIQGRVICEFIVDKDGTITNVQVVRSGGHYLLDAEAVRVISSMPKWVPGTQRGKPVRVKYTVPVNFHLKSSSSKNKASAPAKSRTGFSELRYRVVMPDGSFETIDMPTEKIPHFKGGVDELLKIYNEHLNYPTKLQEQKIEGKGIVTFDVAIDGHVSNVHVIRSSGNAELDMWAAKAVKFVSRWSPAVSKKDSHSIICSVNFEFVAP